MRISRQTKHTLTLILGTAIGFLMVTLLLVNIAMPGTQSTPQAAAGSFAGEQAQTSMTAEQPVPEQPEPAQATVAAAVAPVVTEETPPDELALPSIQVPEAGTSKGWFSANTKLAAFFIMAAICVILFCVIIYLAHILVRNSHDGAARLSEALA